MTPRACLPKGGFVKSAHEPIQYWSVGMSNELIAILLVGVLLAVAELGTFALSFRVLREMQREMTRTQRLLGGLIVQESEKIQELLRA